MLVRLTLSILVMTFVVVTGIAMAQHPDDVFVGQKAPALKASPDWINSTPLQLESLRGKTVLLTFWAFDCPYCAEALPYVKEWHEKYAADGLIVIGVHTPRNDKERNVASLREAVKTKGIRYAVVADNKYDIWGDYLCNVWPSHFVIDREGVIQLSHSGVGRYEDTEKIIEKLLGKTK
jgi:thiol-disulfide isomerase/thioredoxin